MRDRLFYLSKTRLHRLVAFLQFPLEIVLLRGAHCFKSDVTYCKQAHWLLPHLLYLINRLSL
jgi:hypothetical protein